MAFSNEAKTVTVLVLVIGLLIGSGVGYFITLNNFQPKLNEKEDELDALNQQYTELNDTVSEFQAKISSDEEKITLLNEEAETLSNNLTQALENIDNKEKTIEEQESELSSVKNQNSVLTNRLGERNEWKLYNNYNVKFEYPPTAELSKLVYNESAGMIFWLDVEKQNFLTLVWGANYTEMDFDEVFKSETSDLEGTIKLMLTSTSTVNDHKVTTAFFTMTSEGEALNGILGTWYCKETNRTFIIVTYGTVDLMSTYYRFLDSVNCHSEGTNI